MTNSGFDLSQVREDEHGNKTEISCGRVSVGISRGDVQLRKRF